MNTTLRRCLATLLAISLLLALAGCQQEPSPSAGKPTGSQPAPSPSCTHADQDDNDYCDLCKGYLLVSLDIYAINDIHGKFLDSSTQPGVDELTTYLATRGDNAILLSSGDTWQGSSESNLTQGALMTQWMNELGFVSMTLGNHEFDWGEEYIENNKQIADFPFLAINIYDRETGKLADYCSTSVIVERSGIQVGIIGAIGDCYSSISGDKTQNITFQTGNALTELVKAESIRLRSLGADIIVYSLHDGSSSSSNVFTDSSLRSYYDVSLSDGYVDLVFEGHTHQRYTGTDSYGVYHLQGGGENNGISYAEVVYDLMDQQIRDVNAQIISSQIYDDYEPHSLVDTLLEQFQDQISIGDRVVGTVSKYQSGSTLQQLVPQLYYQVGMERWGADYEIVLAGGLISIRNPYNLEAGPVKYSQLQSLFPFDNQIVLCSVKGKMLKSKFFESRNDNYYLYYEAYGQSVRDNLDPEATYYIITDTYTSSYPSNELTEIARFDETTFARDLLADYIAAGHLESGKVDTENYTLTSIADALEICQALKPGDISADAIYVKGTVVSIASTRYGNLTIADEKGNQLYIYGTYDITGSIRYDSMSNPPQVGDTVVLYGKLQHYIPKSGAAVMEMIEAQLVALS